MALRSIFRNLRNSAPVRFTDGLLARWRKPSSLSKAPHIQVGRRGEILAARFLKQRGHRILYRNFRPKDGGEIDLITRDGNLLVFVEVKTRRSEKGGRPLDAVNARKRQRVLRGAAAWLRMLDHPEIAFRFDVVEVILESPVRIRVVEGAFGLPSNSLY